MKRFKKVLALVLAGVLALAMLTGCKVNTDPDKKIPEDGVSPDVVMAVNSAMNSKGWGYVEYSAQYSKVATNMLTNWLNYSNNKINAETYWANYNKYAADLKGAKILIGLQAKSEQPNIPTTSAVNPVKYTSFKASSIITDDVESQCNLADRIAVGVVTTTKAGIQTKYVLVCLIDTN